ncbi:bacterio-opsin activator domain-containing protein [Halovivax limisalsi]|uniref:bacterio-opsin activator domain-containing protein n=1 Tax=Halovivax limisalsi TaxID=1453760 RepID=UPI001FFD001D|nr:bacterio-opsin activator domain-containing protein [Halovivax limisalsi]
MTADATLDVLLIEDNPGDARLIEELLRAATRPLVRSEAESADVVDARVRHEPTLDDGLDRAPDADVVLLDLGLPGSTGLETVTAVADAVEFVPIVVLTGNSDEEIAVCAIERGAQDYLVKDKVTSELLVRTIRYAIERTRQDRERARRRSQLETLNRLNEIGQDVTHAVITTSTREELERAVCDRLVESDAYRFAWIGEVNGANDRITPRVAAGVEDGYLDEVTITATEGETAKGPAGRAARTMAVQTVQNAQTDPAYEPWRAEAIERGYRSSASIPIRYESVLYGLLNVYSAAPEAFSRPETDILSRLGTVIGHAITAIERKQALIADTVLRFEFDVAEPPAALVSLTTDGGRVDVENVVRTDDSVVGYGRTRDVSPSAVRDAAESTALVDDVRVLADGEDGCEFEATSTAAAELVDAVGTHGGRVTGATVEGGSLQFAVEFPPGRDKRQLRDLVRRHCPGARTRAQRTVEQTDDISALRSIVRNALTAKQRVALETAFAAGLYDWPRKTTGQELADRLDIAPATFNQRLRAAERRVFESLFSTEGGEPTDTTT